MRHIGRFTDLRCGSQPARYVTFVNGKEFPVISGNVSQAYNWANSKVPSRVLVTIHDRQGRMIRVRYLGKWSAGASQILWLFQKVIDRQ